MLPQYQQSPVRQAADQLAVVAPAMSLASNTQRRSVELVRRQPQTTIGCYHHNISIRSTTCKPSVVAYHLARQHVAPLLSVL
eukprot:11370-Heterococcus_DN1.PRE.3